MNSRFVRNRSSGMALVELAIALLVLGVIAIGSVYVWEHRAATNPIPATTAVKPGTTASIEQATQADAQNEQQTVSNSDAQAQQDALSANAAASNVGGAYNESTL